MGTYHPSILREKYINRPWDLLSIQKNKAQLSDKMKYLSLLLLSLQFAIIYANPLMVGNKSECFSWAYFYVSLI